MRVELAGVLPVPDCCHACASERIRITILQSEKRAWVCDDCGAIVTCHDGSDNPVGYMAGKRTRDLRKAAHDAFDILWKERLLSRDKAYNWLAAQVGVLREQAHISWLTEDQLKIVIERSNEYYEQHAEALRRRKDKNDEKRGKRHARENAHAKRKIIERKRR